MVAHGIQEGNTDSLMTMKLQNRQHTYTLRVIQPTHFLDKFFYHTRLFSKHQHGSGEGPPWDWMSNMVVVLVIWCAYGRCSSTCPHTCWSQ